MIGRPDRIIRASFEQYRVLGYQSAKKFLGSLYMCAHSTRNSNQILHRDYTILEENFYWATTPPAPANNLLTRMLTRDLFAETNLPVITEFCLSL